MLDRDTLLTMCASLRSQVGSVQAQIVALEAVIGIADDGPQEPPERGCRHDQGTTNQGTFGAPDWRCEGCGEPVEAPR
jgi:hypothetical protein